LYRKKAVTWPFNFYTIIWTLSLFLNRDIVAELNFPLEAKVTAAPSLNIRKTPDLNLDPIGSISQGTGGFFY